MDDPEKSFFDVAILCESVRRVLFGEFNRAQCQCAVWGVSERRVQYLCANNQVIGAQRLGGKVWVIPKEAPKPVDGRTKAATAKECSRRLKHG